MTNDKYPAYIGFNRGEREASKDSPDNYEKYLGRRVVVAGSKMKLEGVLAQIGEDHLLLRVDGRSDGEATGGNSATIKKSDITFIGPSTVIFLTSDSKN